MNQITLSERSALSVRVLRMRDLRDRLQLSNSQVFSLIARGLLPKPFPIVPGGRAVGWLESDITDWILQRKAEGETK
jgi:prophage regulatory protein